jgi:hypothetical protein
MTDSDTRTEMWKPVPGFARYEVSDLGRIRNAAARIMATNPNNNGYLRLNLVDDHGVRQNVLVHRCVLLAHAGACPEGMEACHGPGGHQDNRLVNLRWDTKPENERDKIAAGTTPKPNPTYPCLNYAVCGQLVIHEGRRCRDCVMQVGQEAAAMLGRGVNLYDVAEHFGYTAPDWVWRLAVEAGHSGSKRQALTQQPSLSQRVTGRLATLRARRGQRSAGGDAA